MRNGTSRIYQADLGPVRVGCGRFRGRISRKSGVWVWANRRGRTVVFPGGWFVQVGLSKGLG